METVIAIVIAVPLAIFISVILVGLMTAFVLALFPSRPPPRFRLPSPEDLGQRRE